MAFSTRNGNGGRRKSAIRSGLLAVSAAVTGLCSTMTAKADITNGFSGFATVNFAGQSTLGSVGYSSNGSTFVLTDGRGSEAASGFATATQTVTSFDATYTYQESGSGPADGATFCIQNNGTTALGNAGGGLGYSGIGNSAAIEFNIYSGYTIGSAYNTGGGANNTFGTTGAVSLTSGDPIQVTLEYFNNTLTENLVDLKSNASYGRIFTNVNIPSALGNSNTGYVGFTGGTGGSTATQQVSNFTFVSGTGPSGPRLYNPITIAGYNQQGVISVAGGQSSVTATMDAGTGKTGDTWYEKGWNTFNASTGLPTSGSTFTSQYDSSHVFTMANYSNNDVVLLNKNAPSATISFTTPGAYSALSFLESCGNGPSSFKVTVNYADGATSTAGLSVITPDWFNGGPSAYFALGRDTLTASPSSQPDSYAQGTGAGTGPNLYEEDLILPDSTDPIASLSLTFSGTNAGTNMMIFAVSGVVANSAPLITYTGAGSAGKFDTSTINFTQNSSGTLVPVTFANGDQVIFDDTASDMQHNITVASVAGGIKVGGLIFNNTTATNPYTFTGAGIGGPGGVSINDGGTVIFDNPNTFTGGTYINSGQLQVNTGGALASSVISISSGAQLLVNGGSLTGTGINLSDSGTFSYSGSTLSLAGLSGGSTGQVTTTASALNLTLTGSSSFSGNLNLNNGNLYINANGSSVTLTGQNNYQGNTYLQAGALYISGQSAVGSGNITLQGGALGAVGGTVNLSTLITGSALNIATGSTPLELSNNANTFTGPVALQAGGTLQLDTAGSIGGLTGSTASVTVASGASLVVNDYSGSLGLTGGTSSGAPITLNLSGTGVGNNGALTTTNNGTGNWAGNINISGQTTVAPGIGGNLTLSGNITGTGPVLFAANSNDSGNTIITLASKTGNTYTGETQVAGDYGGTFAALTISLGGNNGFSSASGVNLVTGGAGAVSIELNGYNQSTQYLTGGTGASFQISNAATTTSTLRILNGNTSTGTPTVFPVPIIGNIRVVKTGTGNQTLSGSNTYTGGTTVSQGTLTATNSSALGNGGSTINLSGGTLALGNSTPVPVQVFSGFSTFAPGNGVLLNTNASNPSTVSGDNQTLTLTNNTPHANASIFTAQKVALNLTTGFVVSYTYQPNDPNNSSGYLADGAAFVLQNDPRGITALGDGGGAVGYSGANAAYPAINNSFAAILGIYKYNYSSDVAFGVNGSMGAYTSTNPEVNSQQDQITLSYNGSNHMVTEVVAEAGNTSVSQTITYSVNLAQVLGNSTAYMGFTGGEGDGSAQQLIQNFSYSNLVDGPVSLTQPIVATSGATSSIQVTVATGYNTESIGSLTLQTSSTLNINTASGSIGRVVLHPTSLSIAGSGSSYTAKLDLGSNDLVIPGASLSTVTSMLKQGYANGAWTGNGIASAAAAADSNHLTALGVIANDNGSGTPLYGNNGTIANNFDGSTPNDGDILVKFTYYGDANLDGAVDGSDYSLIDSAYAADKSNPSSYTGWQNGDFNYDGVIDGSDYTLIDNAFNSQGTSLGSNPLAQIAAQVGTSAVPEPATVSLLAIGATGLLSRRKRRM